MEDIGIKRLAISMKHGKGMIIIMDMEITMIMKNMKRSMTIMTTIIMQKNMMITTIMKKKMTLHLVKSR